MHTLLNYRDSNLKKGFAWWFILLFFLLLIMLVLGLDDIYIANFACEDAESRSGCVFGELLGGDDEEELAEGVVTATGVVSRAIKGSDRSATIVMNIPLQGGSVTGSISGDCEGSLKGTYSNGALSGTGKGVCGYFFPVKGTFTGSVNKQTKKVVINGTGEAVGKSGSGSATLSYE